MRLSWLATTGRAIILTLLIVVIIAITTATLWPAIYRSAWFQNRYITARP